MSVKHKSVDYEVIVVGAGVIGASAALAMRQLGYQTLLIDGAAEVKDMPSNIRATALGEQAKQLLMNLGVWDDLSSEQVHPYTKMQVWDENSSGELCFDAIDSGLTELGYICDHFALQKHLQQRCAKVLDTRYESLIEAVDQHDMGVELSLQDGTSLSANLLIAADGVNSFVRQHLGVTASAVDYQQTGIVAQIHSQHPHQNTAWQRFLSTGPLALLPLANGNCSIVWSMDNSSAEVQLNNTADAFEARLTAVSQGVLGDIKLVGKRYGFPLKSVKADQYLTEQVLFIGDAAHGIHPLAGQGANLGLADVAELLKVLNDKPKLVDARRNLRRYERTRKVDNYRTDSMMSAINNMFLSEQAIVSSIRGVGMNWINKRSALKQFFIDAATRAD